VTGRSIASWIEQMGEDEDARRLGVDGDRLAAESDERIDAWNQLGRGLCRRFLETAAARQ
jgi:hypothetical protein